MSIFGGGTTGNPPALGGFNNNQQQGQQQQPTGSIFGQSQNTQQPNNASVFGNSGAQQQSAFGNPPSNTGTGGSVFGGLTAGPAQQIQPGPTFSGPTQPMNSGGSVFGGATQQQQPQQQQQQQQPAAGGSSLFGGSNNNGNSLFGKPSIFSTNTNTNATNAGTTGNTGAPTNSLFGGGSFSSLGQTQQPQQIQPTASGSANTNQPKSLFGSFGQPASNNPLLGGGNPPNNNGFGSTMGGLGGNTSNTQNNNGFGGSLLGGSTLGGLGGNTSNTQNNNGFGGSLLGGSTLGGGTSGGFGGLGGSMLGASSLQQSNLGMGSNSLLASRGPVQPQADTQVQFARLTEKIEGIANAWNPQSPQCRFQHCFYNLVDPSQVNMYGRPPNATNEALWQKAVRENPDSSCLVPVIATGFDDLRERVDAQSQQATAHQEKLKDIQSRLSALTVRHSTSTTPRLSRFSSQQTQITLRLMAFIQHLHLLIPAIRSSSIRPEEEELRKKLDEIEQEISGGGGRLRGKLGELWAVLGAVRAREGARSGNRGSAGGEWKVVDEDGLARIAQVLSEQQAGLAHLTKVLQQQIEDLAVIMGTGSSGGGDESNDGDSMMNSTSSTLRASSLW